MSKQSVARSARRRASKACSGATWRPVPIAIFREARDAGWTADELVVALFLLAGEHATRAGVSRLVPAMVAADLGLDARRVDAAWSGLIGRGFLHHDPRACLAFVPAALRTLPPQSPQQVEGVARRLEALPPTVLGDVIRDVAGEVSPSLRARLGDAPQAPANAEERVGNTVSATVSTKREGKREGDLEADSLFDGGPKSGGDHEVEGRARVRRRGSSRQPSVSPSEIDAWIDALNRLTGSRFGKQTDASRKAASRWIRQGYTLADCETAVAGRVKAWRGDAKAEDWLKPSTLFGAKFPEYVELARRRGASRTCDDGEWQPVEVAAPPLRLVDGGRP